MKFTNRPDPKADMPGRPDAADAADTRQDFQDSLIAARHEEAAVERRRAEAMTQALKARGLASDPHGASFLAQRQAAIAARRASNARLAEQALQPPSPPGAVPASASWQPAAERRKPSGRFMVALPIAATVLLVLGAWLAAPFVSDLVGRMFGG